MLTFTERALLSRTAARASSSAVLARSVSRLSWNFLPLARAISHFILPFFRYSRVGIKREAFFPGRSQQFVDFAAVQQQFALADRAVIVPVAVAVLADVGVQQPGFVLFDLA